MNEKDIGGILQRFERAVDQYFSKEELEAKLRLRRPLRIKYGVDVRTPTLHIGHAVNLWLMRYLQDLGHKVIFVIGDFTTRIGDPDGRLETRPLMADDEIAQNIELFIEQAKLVLRFDDPRLIEVRRNSEWYDKLSMRAFMDIAALVTHARLISRDTFRARIAHGKEIYVHETLYPILQGYDSVVVESDLAIIGSDQLFNESMGRLLQEKHGKSPQALITTKITPGIDGRGKQSKSAGNYIGLAQSPRDKFGRVMSIPDELIRLYFEIYTDMPLAEIDAMADMIAKKPRDAKRQLARSIVGRYHGHEVAEWETEWFEHTISKGLIPDVLPVLAVMSPMIDALNLVALARYHKSRSDTRRLLRQGGVELNGGRLDDPDKLLRVKTGDILKVGKRNWFRIEISRPIRLETERLWMEPVHLHEIDFLTKYLPAWELVKYLGIGPPGPPKVTEAKAREHLREIIFQKDPRSEWLWKIMPKNDPENILGIAHLRRDAEGKSENIWLAPGISGEDEIRKEAQLAMNDYAFFMLDFQSLVFKDAFSLATAPKSMDTLSRMFMKLDPAQLNRDAPFGAAGFTKEGWKILQDWRRAMSPSLFVNDPGQKPSPPAPETGVAPPPKQAKPRPVREPAPPGLLAPRPPSGSTEEDE